MILGTTAPVTVCKITEGETRGETWSSRSLALPSGDGYSICKSTSGCASDSESVTLWFSSSTASACSFLTQGGLGDFNFSLNRRGSGVPHRVLLGLRSTNDQMFLESNFPNISRVLNISNLMCKNMSSHS